MKETTAKRSIRNDIILIICLLLISVIGMFYLFVLRKNGDTITVTVDGKNYGTYSLSQNITEDIYTGKNKEQHNRLIIKDGKAYMDPATCPDGICVDHAPIFRDGESIVCLPNRVVITVTKHHSKDDADIVL